MEDRFIDLLRREMETVPELNRHLIRGIGDDAAILKRFRGNMAVTADLLCDGIDFRIGVDSPRDIGRKALAVNLSDLAAMGAVPLAVVVSLLLPRRMKTSWKPAESSANRKKRENEKEAKDGGCDGVEEGAKPIGEEEKGGISEFALEFYRGLIPLAKRYNVSMAGGDTNSWDGAFAVSVTAFGAVSARNALLRNAARPGDRILVTGPLGGSIFGRQFRFMPRVTEALFLARHYQIDAAIDISDGLTLDLSRLARESGVGFLLDEKKVPIHPDVFSPPSDAEKFPGWETDKTPLAHALGDGEDFELILAVPPGEAERLLTEQPFVEMGREAEKGGRNRPERNSSRFEPDRLKTEIDSLHASSSPLARMMSLCAENRFGFLREDFQPLTALRLTDIGSFTRAEEGMNRRDAVTDRVVPVTDRSGWSYRF